MNIFEIEKAKITCSKCKTSVIVPLNAESYRLAKEKEFQFQCPTCGNDLTEIMATARHHALQYNKSCQDLKDLEAHGCDFADIGGF